MLTLINYGLGNINAFCNIYKKLNIEFQIASNKEDLFKAKKLILPGVGAFDRAMQKLNSSGLRETLDKLVLIDNVPILGICVGMQIMAESSEEGSEKGLAWIPGNVKKFKLGSEKNKFKPLPHMGWNQVNKTINCSLFNNIDSNYFYFLHSYFLETAKKENIIATTDYYGLFTSAIANSTIFGVQFHPEKSHKNGMNLLLNFNNISL